MPGPTSELDTTELKDVAALFYGQLELSLLPREDQLLVETCTTREGSHLYIYPFEGRFVHEGLGFLLASRLTDLEKGTITVSVNDYGFELLAPRSFPIQELVDDHLQDLLSLDDLEADLERALNLSELCRRRFRAIAQVAGLTVQGFPGSSKTTGQLQISAALIYDVFERHEPENRLLLQARAEVLEEQLELPRLRQALERIATSEVIHSPIARPGPLAFPLLVERLNNRMSNESVLERVQRMMREAEKHEG